MDASLNSSRGPELDESYWSALLEQEDVLAPPPAPPDTPDENWVPMQQRVDGRFRWADGGKPAESEAWRLAQTAHQNDETIKLPHHWQ